jgi:hypothetical protein
MKYFVIVSLGNDCTSLYNFYIDEPSKIAKCILEESELSFSGLGRDLKRLEGEYYCDFESYRKLKRRRVFFPVDLIQYYSFTLSDMYVSTYAMTNSIEDVIDIIDNFIEENEMDYQLKTTSLSEEDICNAFYELAELYNGVCDKPKYYIKNEDEE